MQRASMVEGLRDLHDALDRVADSADGAADEPSELRWGLSEVARAEARLASLKLALAAAAEASNVASEDGSTDTSSWTAKAVGGNRSRA
jgi:hypothetical protein